MGFERLHDTHLEAGDFKISTDGTMTMINQSRQNWLTETQSILYHCESFYLLIKEASSMLELVLWKTAIEDSSLYRKSKRLKVNESPKSSATIGVVLIMLSKIYYLFFFLLILHVFLPLLLLMSCSPKVRGVEFVIYVRFPQLEKSSTH